MSTQQTSTKLKVDTNKLLTYVIATFMAFLTWFGKTIYDQITDMNSTLKVLLVQSGVSRQEIENLKLDVREMRKKSTGLNNLPVKKDGRTIEYLNYDIALRDEQKYVCK